MAEFLLMRSTPLTITLVTYEQELIVYYMIHIAQL